MSDIPDALRRRVIAEIYRRADEMDWSALPGTDRSRIYNSWLDDPVIGGELTRFMPRDKVRVWIKDCAIKEYPRARAGLGPNADLVTLRWPGADCIAVQILGQQWHVVENSVKDKPLRCVVANGDIRRTMFWGAPKAFRDLLWAGLNAVIDDEPTPILVVTLPQGERLGPQETSRQQRLGRHVGLEVRHTALRLVRVEAAG